MAYLGKTAVLTTKHGKENVIAPLFAEVLGMEVKVHTADTDQLGTFSGTIPRLGTIKETVIAKAKMGLEATGLPYGIASEGAFGPHPFLPFTAIDTEALVFIDQELDFILVEHLFTTETDYHPQTNRDMRAHKNPLRMRAIQQICQQLVQRLACACPACGLPGFGQVELLEGLPCESCGAPTSLVAKEMHGCVKCTFKQEQKRLGSESASQLYCSYCNP